MKSTWGNVEETPCIGKDIPNKEVRTSGSFERDRPPQFMETIDNRIYFYASIYSDKTLQLNKTIRELTNRHLMETKTRGQEFVSPIYLNIYSYGGEVIAGLSCMDEILSCQVPLYTVVDGCCASAATFLSVVGKKRYIKRNAFMLIHQLSSSMWGKYSEFQDEMKNLDMMMNIIKDIYGKYTKVPMEKIDELMKHDIYWKAEECLKYGLVDEIL
jgi:ATP-dependent protease ClpP protease subunit